jgi:FKBP-type peptidyl-prolyl cis-trans isomerase
MNVLRLTYILVLSALVVCCGSKNTSKKQELSKQEMEDALIERNRAFLKQEREQIEAFVDSSGHAFTQTGSGLYYSILNRSGDSTLITEGDEIEYEYDIATLQGKLLSSSALDGNKTFRLLKDDEIIGLHEGIALMHPNDEYLFIIPAHLAYGLGNENGAPLNATLLYKVKIVSVIKI